MADSIVHNEGIIIKDKAKIDAEVLAVGRNASATVYSQPPRSDFAEIEKTLQQLIAAVSRERDSVANSEEIEHSARLVADEARKSKPNKMTIRDVLSGICSGVKSATAVATAVEAFKEAVMVVIG